MAPPRKTLAQYEAEAVRQPNGCLLHPSQGAARKCYRLRHGNPHPLIVCHACDTPSCIEDSHHWPGTYAQNVADSVAKGRHSCFQGNRRGKLASHSEETKRVIGAASKKMWKARSGKAKDEILSKMRGGLTHEVRSAAAKKAWETKRGR